MGYITAAAGALALIAGAQPAAAQICAAQVTSPGQSSIGLRAGFSDGTSIGVEAARNWNNPLGAFASVDLRLSDDDADRNEPTIGAGLAWEIGDYLPPVPAWLSICPVAALAVSFGDNVTTLNIPLGVGFGTVIGTGEGFQILPYIMPQFVFVRISTDELTLTDNDFGIGFGAFAKFPGVYGGITFNRLFETGADIDWTLRAGLTFPARM